MKLSRLLFIIFISTLGYSQISFTATNVLTFSNQTKDLGSGDFVTGGNKELLVITSNGYGENITGNQNLKQISLNNGGVISSTNLTYNGTNPFSLETGDFNGDGFTDAIFSGDCNCSYAGLFLGSANGLVNTSTTLSYSRFTNDISSGLILNNGKTSIATGGNAGIQVNISTGALNTVSYSTFYDHVQNGNSSNDSWGFAVGDMNNDGLGDVIAAHPMAGRVKIYYSQNSSPYLRTVSSNASNNYGMVDSISVTSSGLSQNVIGVSVGDINNDGVLEFAAVIKPTTSASRAIVIFKKVNGVYTLQQTISIADYAAGWVKLKDINGDGKADLITADGSVKVFLADQNGSFASTPSNTLNAFAGQDRVEIDDFNNDGLMDIAAIGAALKQVVIYLQGLPPTITSQPSTTSQSMCINATPTDLSITATNATSYQWSVSNTSNGTYTNITGATSSTYTPPTNVAGMFFYKCKAMNNIGTVFSNASGFISVGITAANASATPGVCDGSLMTPITHATVGVTSYGYPTGLPAGMALTYNNNVFTISGSPSNTFNVGDYYNGGRIAYIFQPTDNGYIPGKVIIVDPQYKYLGQACTSGRWTMDSQTASTSALIGEGLNNTYNLAAAGHTNSAYCVGWANAYSDGVYNDWFVPSKDELIQILTNTSYFPWDGFYIRSSTEIPGNLGQTYAYGKSGSTILSNTQNDGGCANLIIARYDILPVQAAIQTFNYSIPLTGSCGTTFATGTITITDSYTWTGQTNTSASTASNWNPAAVPCSGANVIIPSGLTNYPTFSTLTINSGANLTVQSGAKLDITGVLTNNGTLTIESGATLVQGTSSTLAGTGTYIIKQAISGAGSTTPSGRFWYLGSPVSLASSSVYFGNAANVVKKRDEVNNAWTALSSGTPENLVVGRGYYTQAMANSTINFTGGVVNNGAITISGLTRTAGQGFEGFNLVSNPYPSYLNWDAVTKTNVGGTMWYRTYDGTNMVFDTYVAGTAGGLGTNLGGNMATKWIPPMQSFWVRVNSGSTTGSLGLTNAMRSHFASLGGSAAGLRSTNDELKLFLRMNLLQANKKDQIIVYVNGSATNGFDALDGEKMMQAGIPQFYTKAADKKITINGLNSAKKQQALPITMELPTTGVHSFVIEDLEIDNGLVWLEDKQEAIIQALEPGTVYEFYANSGINAERFVLHFQLLDTPTPTNTYNEVGAYANFNGKGASVHAEAAGVVVIKLPASTECITDIQIRDAAGKLVYTGSTNTLETSVQLEQANGIYYVTLNGTSGVEVRKVFIQQ